MFTKKNSGLIHLMYDEGVTRDQVDSAKRAVRMVLESAKIKNGGPKIRNLGVWKTPRWLDKEGFLTPWESVDWYLADAQDASRNKRQLHGGHLLKLFYNEPWREMPHIDVAITSADINDDDCEFCIGLAVKNLGAVISTSRFQRLNTHTQNECIATATMHEVGHIFGLVPESRTKNVEESFGLHCTNRCIMRQGLNVPHDWVQITQDRLEGYGFCPTCQSDLQKFFQ